MSFKGCSSVYCFERLLYRLGTSTLRDRFVLKGAMLLRVWSEHPYRASSTSCVWVRPRPRRSSRTSVRFVTTPVEPDAVEFGAAAIRIEGIRVENEYVGIRAKLPARCGKARLTLQIDMGLLLHFESGRPCIADSGWGRERSLLVCPKTSIHSCSSLSRTGVAFGYHTFREGRFGITLGKWLAGVRVVDMKGGTPGLARGAIRTVFRLIEVNPLLFGGIPAGVAADFSRRWQRLGDMCAKTLVLKYRDLKQAFPESGPAQLRGPQSNFLDRGIRRRRR